MVGGLWIQSPEPRHEKMAISTRSISSVDLVREALANAPLDDEIETPDERKAVSIARAELSAGRVISDEELCRELKL